MIACVQRVKKSYVKVSGDIVDEIGKGLNILLGFEKGDKVESVGKLAKKCCELRIFEDEYGKMSKSLIDVGGEILVISQFTLAGDLTRGRRPDFTNALNPIEAEEMYNIFLKYCSDILGVDRVKKGVFGAEMEVMIVNDGPVTFFIKL